jgi:hypothetical protein
MQGVKRLSGRPHTGQGHDSRSGPPGKTGWLEPPCLYIPLGIVLWSGVQGKGFVAAGRGGTRRRGHGPETGQMGREHLHRGAPRPPGDSTPVSRCIRDATDLVIEGYTSGGGAGRTRGDRQNRNLSWNPTPRMMPESRMDCRWEAESARRRR